jgi:hypothetical protein
MACRPETTTSHRQQAAALFRDTRKSRGHSTLLLCVPLPPSSPRFFFLRLLTSPDLGRPVQVQPIIPFHARFRWLPPPPWFPSSSSSSYRRRRSSPSPRSPATQKVRHAANRSAALLVLSFVPDDDSRGWRARFGCSGGADRHQGRAGRPARRAQQLGPVLRRPLQLGHDHLLRQEPRHWPVSASHLAAAFASCVLLSIAPSSAEFTDTYGHVGFAFQGSAEPGLVGDSVREDRQPHAS